MSDQPLHEQAIDITRGFGKRAFTVWMLSTPVFVVAYRSLIPQNLSSTLCLFWMLPYIPYSQLILTFIFLLIRLPATLWNIRRVFPLRYIAVLITFLGCFFFFDRIASLPEMVYFEIHRDRFDELVTLGQGTACYSAQAGCLEHVDLPEQRQHEMGIEDLFVTNDQANTPVIGFLLRRNIYHIHFEDQPEIPDPQIIYRSRYRCFHKLDDGWFLCHVYSTN